MGGRVAGIGPDGQPVTLPEEQAPALQEQGGRVLSDKEGQAARVGIARDIDRQDLSLKDIPETWLAGAHGNMRGSFGAVGLPSDAIATGVADFFGGDEAKKKTADYLKGLDERHPLASGWMEAAGGVNASLGLAELTGLGAATGLRGVAARAAGAGVENVIQATTRDINEDAIGNAPTNGSKLFAKAGERFLLGAGLGLGFEGLAAAGGAGIRALARKAGPEFETGISKAIGREAGLEGEEAIAAGARIRKMGAEAGAGEVPKNRGALVDLLEGGQAAERQAIRKEAQTAGEGLVQSAEKTSAEQTLEGMARGGARVEEAELAGAARIREAHGQAFEANLAAARAADRASGGALQNELSAAGKAYDSVVDRYARLTKTLAEEHAAASEQALALEAERAANSKALADAMKATTQETAAPGQLTRAEFEEMVDTMAGITGGRSKGGKLDPNQRWAAEQFVRDTYGEPMAEAAMMAGRGPEVERLQKLATTIEKAHGEALGRVKQVEGAMRSSEVQAAKDIAAAGKLADQRISQFQAEAARGMKRAEGGAKAAGDNVAKVRAEVEASIEKARLKGTAEAAAAEQAGKKKIAAAEAQAAKLATKAETAPTTVDPLIAGVKAKMAEPVPMVSPWAAWGGFVSAVHGNIAGAAGGLLTSLAAGRARAHQNLLTARSLRVISEAVSSVDNAIREGTALILGRGAATATAEQLSKDTPKAEPVKPPKFEEVMDQVKAVSANPNILEQRIQQDLGPLVLQAPNTYASTLMAAQRANAFLMSILPPAQKNPHSLTPQLETGDVPEAMQYDFMRSFRTISDPLTIYKDINDGSVVDKQIQALEFVHKDLFDQMVGELNRQRTYLDTPIPYEKAIHVGALLGVPTHEVMDPDFQRAQAAAFSDKGAGTPMGSKPKSGTKLDRNTLSAAQRLESGDTP